MVQDSSQTACTSLSQLKYAKEVHVDSSGHPSLYHAGVLISLGEGGTFCSIMKAALWIRTRIRRIQNFLA